MSEIEAMWTDLCEKSDRTSPEGYPDMALITQEEFAAYLREAREQALREAAETFNFIKAIRIAEEAMDTWKNKPHNAKWWRKIDGTPIPNDLLVNIAEAFRDAALSLIEKPKAPSP